MDLKKETMGEMFVKWGVPNDKNNSSCFLRRKKLIDWNQIQSHKKKKKKKYLPSTKVSPPKENPHLMTHDYFVKNMGIGKTLWTETNHWAKWSFKMKFKKINYNHQNHPQINDVEKKNPTKLQED